MFNVSKSAHRFIEKSPALQAVLPKLPRVAFLNPKTLRDKKNPRSDKTMKRKEENFFCGHSKRI